MKSGAQGAAGKRIWYKPRMKSRFPAALLSGLLFLPPALHASPVPAQFRGCDAAGYNVRGRFSLDYGMRQFELQGAAPVRAKKGCAVPHYDMTSKNAKLVFDLAWD